VKIAVCVKRVPDMDVRFRIAADNTSVDEAGLKFDINDFDAWAVEAALQLRDKNPGSEVVAISLGPDVVQETIRKALSMGVDRGVQLKADKVPFDGLSIARALSDELKAGAYDLIKNRALFDASDIGIFAVGMAVSFICAFACVRWLLRYIANHDFTPFAWYRIVFGLIVLGTGYFGLVSWHA